jgi:hypothetical protein
VAAVRTIKEGTTDRDVTERWLWDGTIPVGSPVLFAAMSVHAAVRAGDRAALRALMAHVVWTQLWARRQCLPPYTRVTTRGFPS